MRMKYRPERALSKKHPRPLRPGTGNVHRAAPKTRTIGRSATAAETRDLEPKSHRKASTWPAYSAPQNHPPTQRPKATHPPAGKIRPRRRKARRVRRTRKRKMKTTKRPNRSKQNLSSRKRSNRQRV